ncbi:hypothetical protein Nepgr_009195 [Nepenthes gracilis]|uniref:Retrotransposon gag domain-containing protein n=1 Tax=Nepenthes gracilis TaxID=150966 RepID=A0AAD3S9Z8_NEPGR|nr:hypothetical protein Nepgr_009195 [Nepenthes gracilis]
MPLRRRSSRGEGRLCDREAVFLNLLDRMVDIIENLGQRSLAPVFILASAQASVNPRPTAYDRFVQERVPGFMGEIDQIEADTWIQRLKEVFAVIHCPKEDRVLFSTYCLEGEAHYWWDV